MAYIVAAEIDAGGRLFDRERVGLSSVLINQRDHRDLEAAFVAGRRSVPERVQTIGLLATFRNERGIGDHEHLGSQNGNDQRSVEGHPIEIPIKVSGEGALVSVAEAAHVTEGDASRDS